MLVGLCGNAGSGKSTVAGILARNHGFVEVAFADVIKRTARDWYEFTEHQLWGPSSARNAPDERYNGASPRTFLQKMGTEVGREVYENTWVDYALRVTDQLLSPKGPERYGYYATQGLFSLDPDEDIPPPTGVVISDVRFANELEAIRKWGGGFGGRGKVFKITRGQGLQGAAGEHASERELSSLSDDSFDGIIDNQELSLVQLEELVARIVKNRLHL